MPGDSVLKETRLDPDNLHSVQQGRRAVDIKIDPQRVIRQHLLPRRMAARNMVNRHIIHKMSHMRNSNPTTMVTKDYLHQLWAINAGQKPSATTADHNSLALSTSYNAKSLV